MKLLFASLLVILSSMYSNAQLRFYFDAEQSQAFNNPAMVGAEGNTYLRFAGVDNIDLQVGESSIWNTSLQYSKGIKLNNGNILGFGVGAALDREGPLSNNIGDFAAAYHFRLSKGVSTKHFLSLGSRLGLHRYYLNDDNLRWPSQIDPNTGFNPDIDSGEDIAGIYYLGLDIGVNYAVHFSNSQFLKFGVAVQDLNKPNISLLNLDVSRKHSYVLSAISDIAISPKFHIQPELRYFKYSEMETYILGGNLVYRYSPDKLHFKIGAGAIKNNRYTISIGADVQKVSAKFSYGWQTEYLIHKNAEFSLSYQLN